MAKFAFAPGNPREGQTVRLGHYHFVGGMVEVEDGAAESAGRILTRNYGCVLVIDGAAPVSGNAPEVQPDGAPLQETAPTDPEAAVVAEGEAIVRRARVIVGQAVEHAVAAIDAVTDNRVLRAALVAETQGRKRKSVLSAIARRGEQLNPRVPVALDPVADAPEAA